MKTTLLFIAIAVAATPAFVRASDRGFVGISVKPPDFTVVASVIPDSPAAEAGVRVGDRVVAVGDKPTSAFKTVEEFISSAAGPVGSEIELQLKRSESESIIRVRLRRTGPYRSKIPPDFSPYQA